MSYHRGRGKYRGGNGRGGGGGRSVMQGDDEGASPQSSGCFGFLRRDNRHGHRGAPKNRGVGGGGRGVMQRLGLPTRGRGKGRGQGARGGYGGDPSKHYYDSRQPMWYKIHIPQGKMFGKEYLVEELKSYIEEDFFPVLLKYTETGDVTFFLEDQGIAESIESANNRLEGPNGENVRIRKLRAPCPIVPVDKDETELIKQVLGKRYDANSRTLDMEAFALDPLFKENERHCSLQRNNVMLLVAKLIGENCPEVLAINMGNNRIRFLDYLGSLVFRATNVQRLSLKNNQIERIQELEKLKGWKRMLEIQLDGNPLCNNFKEQQPYISAVHKVFPKVILLDGAEVKPELGFGLDEEDLGVKRERKTVPKFLPGFYVNDTLRRLVETFVIEFFQCYDGNEPENTRQKLFSAYRENAMFTLTIENLDGGGRYSDSELFMEYRRDSHNIKQMERWERYRAKLVHKGAINIISRMTRLPKTQHLMETFIVDVSFAADSLMIFSVMGLFRDGELAGTDSEELRHFTRTFLVVPGGDNKIAVVNDMLFISPASDEQIESYKRLLQKAQEAPVAGASNGNAASQPGTSGTGPSSNTLGNVPGSNTVSAPVLPGMGSGGSVGDPPSQEAKQTMVRQFASESKMKVEWAEKCLVDLNWDYSEAALTFMKMKRENSIPSVAFEGN